MSAASDPAPTVAASTTPPNSPQLPTELWKKVVLNLRNDDLKSARLVNSTVRDLVTPLLFRKIVISMHKANVLNHQQLEASPELSKHVQELYLDLGAYTSRSDVTNLRTYVADLERHFYRFLDLRTQSYGPLHGDNLMAVLTHELAQPLGVECLSGVPRSNLVSGYTSWVARKSGSEAQLFRQGRSFQAMFERCLKAFKNVLHIETVAQWTEHEDASSRFAFYLMRNLPEETINLIPGFKRPGPDDMNTHGSAGLYAAPGTTARFLDFMSLPPRPALNGTMSDPAIFTFVRSMLRALRDTKARIQSLSLPGSDFLGDQPVSRQRRGIIASPVLVTVDGADLGRENLLLPIFRHLRSLELDIDPICDVDMQYNQIDFAPERLRCAVQAMPLIESLSLGFSALSLPHKKKVVSTWFGWTLHDTLLMQDCDDAEADMGAHMYDRVNDDPYSFIEVMEGLASTMEPGAGATMVHPFTGQQITFSPDMDLYRAMGMNPRPLSAGASMRKRCECWGSDPESAMQPNLWPKLKHLSLWNMPTLKADLVRLIKTISSSLRSLELANVHFTKTYHNRHESEIMYNYSAAAGLGVTYQPTAGHEPFPGEAWLDAVEVMVRTLNLNSFELELGAVDKLSVGEKLGGRIDGFESPDVQVDGFLSRYVLEGESSGFSASLLRAWRFSNETPTQDDEENTENEVGIQPAGVETLQDTGKKAGDQKKNKKKRKGKKGKKY